MNLLAFVLTCFSNLNSRANIRMNNTAVVLVMVYNDTVMNAKLHCESPMSRAEKMATNATLDRQLDQDSTTRSRPVMAVSVYRAAVASMNLSTKWHVTMVMGKPRCEMRCFWKKVSESEETK